MKYKDLLTILVPLKDRENDTKQFLNFLSSNKCPFSVFFCDGSKQPSTLIQKYIEDTDLNIKYKYYQYDNCINQYIKKLSLSHNEINTPFTVIVDHDDRIDFEGFKKGIDFLLKNDDYSCYRGTLRSSIKNKIIYKEKSLDQESCKDRLFFALSNYKNQLRHDIKKTKISKLKFNIVDDLNVIDWQLVMTLDRYWEIIFGKACRDLTSEYYFHKAHSSITYGRGLYYPHRYWMNYDLFYKSLCMYISIITNGVLYKEQEEDTILLRQEIAQLCFSGICKSNNVELDIKILNKSIENSYQYDDIINKNLYKQ